LVLYKIAKQLKLNFSKINLSMINAPV